MKLIHLLLFFVVAIGMAQVKGNKSIETRTFDIKNVEIIKINFYAKVTIDASAKEGMTITTDTNLFDLIEKDMDGNTLVLDQKKWISPSQDAIITIGAPGLKRVETGTHDLTKIINVNNDELSIMSTVGNVIIEGKTKQFGLGVELATVDASKLIAENAYINIWSLGSAKVHVTNTLEGKVSNSGKLVYVAAPKSNKISTKKEGKVFALKDIETLKNLEAKYIKFKIKNNSAHRNQFYVVGPKQDGSKFSYGFPMMPLSTRKENWTIGTKVYKVNKLGFKKLLITITANDEGETVKLF